MLQEKLSQTIQFDLFGEPTLYLDSDRWGFFSVLTRKPDAKNYHCKQESYQLCELPKVLPFVRKNAIDKGLDAYITQATFTKANRRKVNVASLGQMFVDLDYYHATNPVVKSASPEKVLDLALARCDSVGLPHPSIVMFSGRGIYLKWLHENLPAKVVKKWEWAQQYLNQLFADLGSDSNAKDVSRVLRLEDTVNHKTGMVAEVMTLTTINGSVAQYKFSDQLCSVLLPRTDEEVKAFKEKAKSWNTKKTGIILDSKSVFGYKRLNHARYLDIIKLCDMRFGLGGAEDGQRDQFLWIACNYFALANKANRNLDMWQEFYQIAALIAPDWNQAKIRSSLGIIFGKYKDSQAGKTIAFAGKEYDPLFTHKTTTLIDDLRITIDEQRQLSTLISKQVKGERDADYQKRKREEERKALGKLSRSEQKEHTEAAVINLLKQGYKGKDIAEKLGITPARVSQIKKLNEPSA